MPSRRTLLAGLAVVLVVSTAAAAVPLAERRALAAEESYVADRLDDADCLDDWGTMEGAATKRVAVTGVTPGGLRVSVEMPYAYTTEVDGERVFADTASEAVYAVSPTDARRERGDEITLCD